MAASPTKKKQVKKLARNLAEKQVVADIMYTYLNWWTRQEIDRLVTSGELLLIPAEHGGYYVGKYLITQTTHSGWEVCDAWGDHIGYFSGCQIAVFYSMFEQKNWFKKATDLKRQDREFLKLDNDVKFYHHKYKQARATGSGFDVDLWEARLSDSTPRLDHAREELQKLVTSAKYTNKVWEKQP